MPTVEPGYSRIAIMDPSNRFSVIFKFIMENLQYYCVMERLEENLYIEFVYRVSTKIMAGITRTPPVYSAYSPMSDKCTAPPIGLVGTGSELQGQVSRSSFEVANNCRKVDNS